jgi:hypothetical protein
VTETIDRLKILKGNAAYPRGGTCKICGFGGSDVCFRFSDVCGLHDCLVKAGVCDCIACQKKKKADIERQSWDIVKDLSIVLMADPLSVDDYSMSRYVGIAERAEKLLEVSSD